MINGGQIPSPGGVTSLNLLTGALALIGGANISITPGIDTIRIDASGYLSGITSNVQDQINALLNGRNIRGNWDASVNLFPSTGGSGPLGAILAGDQWQITVTGTLGGKTAIVGSFITAIFDSPGQTGSNWNVPQDLVTSIFGRMGAVVATTGDYAVSQITGAAPLISPTFTGTPKAPTRSAGDNSTNLATTAYADAIIASGIIRSVNSDTTADQLITGNQGIVIDSTTTPGTTDVSIFKDSLNYNFNFTLDGQKNYAYAHASGITLTLPATNIVTALHGPLFEITIMNLNITDSYIGLATGPVGTQPINGALNPIHLVGPYAWATLVVDPLFGWLVKAIGSVETAPTNQFVTGISGTGGLLYAQPAFTNISGTATIAQGGTGQTTANAALNAFLPSQTSNANKLFITDGINTSWAALSTLGVTSFNTRIGAVTPTTGDYTVSQITGAAPLISPTFTGTPAAPTASPGTNTTQLATTAFTTTALALKANLVSPTFTGVPAAPTASPGTSTTQLATTAFVTAVAPAYTNAAASGNFNLTNQYVLTTQDADGSTMRLPDASTTLFNVMYTIYLTGSAQNATITVPTGQYLNNVLNGTYSIISTPGAVASFRSNGANYWVQIDDVAAINLKAPLASPALTGTPTAPTPAQNDNSTKLATTAYADAVTNSQFLSLGVMSSFNSSTDYLVALTGTNLVCHCSFTIEVFSGTSQLNVHYQVATTYLNFTLQPKILITQVTDSSNIITKDNLSNYITFFAHLRAFPTANPYVAVSIRMSGGLLYGASTYFLYCAQFGYVLKGVNATVTQYIAQLLTNLTTPYPADSSLLLNGTTVQLATYPASTNYAYCVNGASTNIGLFDLNSSTGILTPLAGTPTVTVGTTPFNVKITPNGKFLYASCPGNKTLYMFKRNTLTGQLVPVSGSPISLAVTPTYMAMHPTGNFLYVVMNSGNSVSGYLIDQSTGGLTLVNNVIGLTNPLDIVINPLGTFMYINDATGSLVRQYTLNTNTGFITANGTSTAVLTTPINIGINPTGTFVYSVNNGNASMQIWTVNTNGTLTAVASLVGTGNGPRGMCFSPDGLFAYNVNATSNTVGCYSVNTTTGAFNALTVATYATGTAPIAIQMSAAGNRLYVTNSGTTTISMFSRDTATGALTPLGTVGAGGAGPNNIALT